MQSIWNCSCGVNWWGVRNSFFLRERWGHILGQCPHDEVVRTAVRDVITWIQKDIDLHRGGADMDGFLCNYSQPGSWCSTPFHRIWTYRSRCGTETQRSWSQVIDMAPQVLGMSACLKTIMLFCLMRLMMVSWRWWPRSENIKKYLR